MKGRWIASRLTFIAALLMATLAIVLPIAGPWWWLLAGAAGSVALAAGWHEWRLERRGAKPMLSSWRRRRWSPWFFLDRLPKSVVAALLVGGVDHWTGWALGATFIAFGVIAFALEFFRVGYLSEGQPLQ